MGSSKNECPESFIDNLTNKLRELLNNLEKGKEDLFAPSQGSPGKEWYNFYGSRPMKFPYTFTAKLVQMPWAFHIKNNWFYRYYMYGILASMPIFLYLERLSKSPANVEKWKEIRRKEEEEFEHKFD